VKALRIRIEMQAKSQPRSRLLLLFHSLGLSCLGGSIFLQILVFLDIAQQGYFTAVERNPAILAAEISLTGLALVYFVYMYQRFVRSIR
jgi:hypothetical protein